MTFSDALDSPALPLLLRLEADGFDLTTDGDRLWVTPTAQLTGDDRAAITGQREALIVLVRHCTGEVAA